MSAGGPGSGRHPDGLTTKEIALDKNIDVKKQARGFAKEHQALANKHDKLAQTSGFGSREKHENLSDAHNNAAEHFNRSVDNFEKGKSTIAKQSFKSGMSIRNKLKASGIKASKTVGDTPQVKVAPIAKVAARPVANVKMPSMKAPKVIGKKPPMIAGGPGSGRHKAMIKEAESVGFTKLGKNIGTHVTMQKGGKGFLSLHKGGKSWSHLNSIDGTVARGTSVDSLKEHLERFPKVNSSVTAGGPGSGRRPEDMIDPSHKHMFELYNRVGGKNGDLHTTKVTGNSGAHAIKRWKQANPDVPGGNNAHHLASKAQDGSWRVPTVSVNDKGFGALPVDKWDKYKG